MTQKTKWQNRLDAIVSGEIEKPELVQIMRLPDLEAWAPGEVTTHWDVDPAFLAGGGSLFGGYIASLADQVLSHAAYTVLDDAAFIRTIHLDVEFYLPIKKGRLDILGKVTHQAKTRLHCEVSFAQDGQRMAQATGIQQIALPKPQPPATA
jgi:uncharacterized protein (TIGR00369 family)